MRDLIFAPVACLWGEVEVMPSAVLSNFNNTDNLDMHAFANPADEEEIEYPSGNAPQSTTSRTLL